MTHRNVYVFLILPVITISCIRDTPFQIPERQILYPNVEETLWPYFATFEREAKTRGLQVDLAEASISASIQEISEQHVAGLCSYRSYRPNEITIDQSFWTRSSSLFRELIVFHELGHCYLGRDHMEDTFPNGLCKSIMRSGTCCCRDAYTNTNRTYYLDELFSKTPIYD